MNRHKTTHEAYLQALKDVWFSPEFKCAPRGLPIREILNYTFVVEEPTSDSIVTNDPDRNKVIEEYTLKEKDLYNSGAHTADEFAKASKFWSKLANPDGTINSAYGYLIWRNKSHGNTRFEFETIPPTRINPHTEYVPVMRTPWEWAKQSLIQDKDTRQAILRFSLPEHSWIGVKDFTCTLHGMFLIRDDKLHFTVNMRSNDLMKGLVFDLPWFVSLMDKMVEELKPTYPNLTKGHYTHFVHSMHAYEKDEQAILKMIGE
jgi:thymidylate synthase